ncbi:ABC transporter permease [Brevibacterium sediminis]|uniref:Transport permease protein n=1 Tax=Brevibacterium sediminis TaxID=1857024 RepID=A0ABQ1N0W5_9MICO|nr:ABC transporter permease [Brevibacterium sediminis]MCS4593327.1 ABC transporter permease [Brevibacterium sediminis]GGC50028.1 transport permease protein [Brevibacterium sediminis]
MSIVREGLILSRRDLAHWGRQPWTPIFNLLFTIMLLLVFAFIFGGSIELPGGGDYIHFLLPGMMTLAMMFGVETTMTTMANDAKKGITDRFRSMPISDASVSLGRAGADMVSSTVEIVILLIGGLLLGWRATNSPLAGLLAVVLLLWLRFAVLWIGIYLGLTVGKHEGATVLVQVLVWPIGFLSNVFAAPEFMPNWLGAVASWNPISATATAVRELFGNPTGVTGGWLDDYSLLAAVAWPLVITAVFVPLSAHAYRRLRK